MKERVSRRKFLRGTALTFGAAAIAPRETLTLLRSINPRKVLVLGIDGMDPKHLKRMMQDGLTPNFARLAAQGYFGELKTTMPPQSPVAWSSFITGTNPGGHGIYDFIHRDPTSFTPYLSTSRTYDGTKSLSVGDWNIPLDSGRVELQRRGTPFWETLAKNDVPATIFALPANFPVENAGPLVKGLSGMGTPDLQGGYGKYTIFTEQMPANAASFSSGQVKLIQLADHRCNSDLTGPHNPFKKGGEETKQLVQIARDPIEKMVRIKVANRTLLLAEGQWSDWVPLSFELLPLLSTIHGIVRFYVKSVHPKLVVYASPINIDPAAPALPICTPMDYAADISSAIGSFYTQGLPADTKALSEGSLNSAEFWEQAKLILHESMKAFDYELARFNEGCLVFYFSSIDQCSHMLMRCMDPKHPLYEPKASAEVKGAINYLYTEMDKAVGKALAKVDSNTTLMVLSDHGFTHFTREFHLNTWLYNNGFLKLTDPSKLSSTEFYNYVDWERTVAYGLGINGIYMNLKGREKNGSVAQDQVAGIKAQLMQKLPKVRDPRNGKQIINAVYDSSVIYSGPYVNSAPDLQVGYAGGYRVSDESILGKFPKDELGDRKDPWASDHCMDPAVVPGTLLTNKPTSAEAPGIWDLAPTILSEFGISPPLSMTGRTIINRA